MTYLGIDLHTRNMTICAVSSNAKKIGEWKLANDTTLLDQLIQAVPEPLKAVVEATSGWYWLADWAQSRDIELVLAHAKMLKAIAYAKVKTDSVDYSPDRLVGNKPVMVLDGRFMKLDHRLD